MEHESGSSMNTTIWCCTELANNSQTPFSATTASVTDSVSSYARDKHEINTFYFYETEQFTLLWTLFALIVLGNSAVLAALLWNNKGRKSRMNYFIMQLAIADLSVGLISVLTDIVWRITVAWNAGNAACKLIRFLQAVVTYSSTYVLVALSIDRYDAITRPMSFSGSWRRARVLVALAWIFSVIFSLPIVLLYHETSVQGRLQCWIDFPEPWQWQLYMTLVAFALFVFPALIITACYTVIVATIWSQGRQLQPPPALAANGHSGGGGGGLGGGGGSSSSHSRNNRAQRSGRNEEEEERSSRRASSRGIIPRAKIKTVKMTFVIVIEYVFMFIVTVFVACWSPYIVFDLLQVYGHVPRTQTNLAVATFIQSLAPLNSAANPLIYCIFSTKMGRAVKPSAAAAAAAAAAHARTQKGATAHLAGKIPALVQGTALVGGTARL